MNPTRAFGAPLYRGFFVLLVGLFSMVVLQTRRGRVMPTVRVRHEVVQAAVVIVVSVGLTAIRRGTTRFSATGILPGHASLVTVGCEAPGTSVSLIPISQGWQRNREGTLRLPAPRRSGARMA